MATPVSTLGIVGAWVLFRLDYYGDLLPNTYYAKKLPLLTDLWLGLRYVVEVTPACPAIPALFLAAVAWYRRHTLSIILAGAILLHMLAVVCTGGDYLPFARFMMPIAGLVVMCICHCAWAVLRVRHTALVLGGVIWLLVSLLAQYQRSDVMRSHDQLERRWEYVGRVLKDHVPPTSTVAVEAIGAIGYYSELNIIDMLGLTNRAIARSAPANGLTFKGHTKFDAGWVLAQKPDIILVGNALLDSENKVPIFDSQRALIVHPEFLSMYRQRVYPLPDSYPLVYYLRIGSQGL